MINSSSSALISNMFVGKDSDEALALWLTSQLHARVAPNDLAKKWKEFIEYWDECDFTAAELLRIPHGIPQSTVWMFEHMDFFPEDLSLFYEEAFKQNAERIIDFADSAGYHDLVAVKGTPTNEKIEDFVHRKK